MFELDTEIMICDGQHRQPLIRDGLPCVFFWIPILTLQFGQSNLKELILKQNDRQHSMLLSILMLIQLTEHSAQIKMCIRKSGRVLHFEFEL